MWYRCGTCVVQRAHVVHDVVGLYSKWNSRASIFEYGDEMHGLVAAVNHHMHLTLTPCPKLGPNCPFQTNPIAKILKITGL